MEKTTGQIICEYRKKKRLTQAALAAELNVTDKAVSKWERDVSKPDINLIPTISEVLGIPVELLLNIPLNTQKVHTKEKNHTPGTSAQKKREDSIKQAQEVKYAYHKSIVTSLLIKGAIGFTGGFLFTLVMALSDKEPFHLGFALLIGFFLAGVPYGWELLQRIIGSWFIIGSFPIMILSFSFKLVGAVMIGWFMYPLALFYHLYKSQRRGSVARKGFLGILIIILLVFTLFIVMNFSSKKKDDTQIAADNITVPSVIAENTHKEQNLAADKVVVDASCFHPSKVAYCDVVENALGKSLAEEQEKWDSGDTILTRSSVKAVYFLSMKDPGTVHNDYGDNVKMFNVLLVVTSYRIDIHGMVQRDNWNIWAYPDFTLDADGQLTYSQEKEYEDFLLAEDRNEVYEWICKEYSDMMITELVIPV